MNIKQISFALAAFLVLISFTSTLASAAISDGTTYTVTLLKYEPTPARPGDIVEAWIQITNGGRVASPPVTLLLAPSYPFTPASAQDAQINIGPIAAASTYVTRVRLAVDTAAADGVYTFPVRLTPDGNTFLSNDISMQIRASSGVLTIVDAQTNPRAIIPGSESSFAVTVENAQASTLRDVTVSINLADTSLATLGTTTKQIISRIDGGAESTFRFQLIADPEAQSGIVRIPLTFTFMNAEGTEVTQTESVGVVVHAAPDVSVLVDRVTASETGKDTVVLVRVINKGLSQIKFAELTLTSEEGYTLVGRDTVYVGNIDSDDFQTAEFIVLASGTSATLKGTLTYRDALNEQYTEPVQMSLAVPVAAKGGSSLVIVLIVIAVVLVVGIIIYRKRSKKQK